MNVVTNSACTSTLSIAGETVGQFDSCHLITTKVAAMQLVCQEGTKGKGRGKPRQVNVLLMVSLGPTFGLPWSCHVRYTPSAANTGATNVNHHYTYPIQGQSLQVGERFLVSDRVF
jgi:hypothetical protein